jgi:trimeric autotransporter adhesin
MGTPYIIPSKSSSILKIGDSFQGGVIFYFLAPGQKINQGRPDSISYDPLVQHGLIAATEDQAKSAWANTTNYKDELTENGLGKGMDNTKNIIGTLAAYAAGIANTYNGGGYTDWYLPSRDELKILLENRVAVGNFTDMLYYWSSTDIGTDKAYAKRIQPYATIYDASLLKKQSCGVRAIRSF